MTRCISRAVVSQPPPGAAGAMISIGVSLNPSTVQAACAETGTSGAETAATAGARTIATRTSSRVPNRGDRIIAPLAADFHQSPAVAPGLGQGLSLLCTTRWASERGMRRCGGCKLYALTLQM